MLSLLSLLIIIFAIITVAHGAQHLRALGAASVTSNGHQGFVDENSVYPSVCPNFRQEPYKARLILAYEYFVDVAEGVRVDVAAIEGALVMKVASYLNVCDQGNRPSFGVELTRTHKELTSESCNPVADGYTCHVISASTVILLDIGESWAKAMAYDAIITSLEETSFLAEYAPGIAHATFSRNINETYIVKPPSTSSSSSTPSNQVTNNGSAPLGGPSVTSAIIASSAAVTFVIVSIFALGYFRRMSKNRQDGIVCSTPPKLGIRRHDYKERDLDDALYQLDLNQDTPSTTWSVSDLTSDASTIKTRYSRGSSSLEIIEEEPLEESEHTSPSLHQKHQSRALSPISSRCIERFDVVDRRNTDDNDGPHQSMMSSVDLSLTQEEQSDDEKAEAQELSELDKMTDMEAEQLIIGEILMSFPSKSFDSVETPAVDTEHIKAQESTTNVKNNNPQKASSNNMKVMTLREIDTSGISLQDGSVALPNDPTPRTKEMIAFFEHNALEYEALLHDGTHDDVAQALPFNGNNFVGRPARDEEPNQSYHDLDSINTNDDDGSLSDGSLVLSPDSSNATIGIGKVNKDQLDIIEATFSVDSVDSPAHSGYTTDSDVSLDEGWLSRFLQGMKAPDMPCGIPYNNK